MHRKEIGGPGGCVVSNESHTPRGEIGGPGGCVVSNSPRGEIGGPGGCVVSNEAHTPRGEIGGPGGCIVSQRHVQLSFTNCTAPIYRNSWPKVRLPWPAFTLRLDSPRRWS
ncbi:hypothetical protein PTTG_29284 [Puccinia triticina 1-1 BBBD Race 1]|uniref:Uncharacterized protein n=1 Tax=Puccinia triticina (isolate 1-1 / race 1 (BBBD)) TaxID=630390 RepID=A0A180G5N8_PUCT1|nr:hypothetical protein PTTG_29284 [Puccinia triticina 1-1 BBBD Race 1]